MSDSIFKKDGFTVLAFKSNLETAFNHGCYIFDRKPEHDSTKFVEIHDNIRLVLQKPTMEELIKNDACFVDRETAENYTYIDGVFFVGFDAVDALINFIRSEKFRIDSEICVFGDFLRPLGAQNKIDYAKCSTQKKLFHLLRPFSIRGLIFRNSVFYHMGTFPELLRHYCDPLESSFVKNFGNCIKPISNCKFMPKESDTNNNENTETGLTAVQGCIMSSTITEDSILSRNCVLEKCYLPNGIEILGGSPAILSNISCPDRLIVDRSIVMCTMSLSELIDGKMTNEYITVVFSLSTDVKNEYANLESFYFFDRPLLHWIKLWNRVQNDCSSFILNGDGASSSEKQIFGANPKTLWYARIFPGFPTMEESSSETWKAVAKLTGSTKVDASMIGSRFSVKERKLLRFFSMNDAFRMKNVPDMLKYRQKLLDKVKGDLE